MAPTRPRILVVDDDPEIRELLRLRLQSRYEVVTAANGHQALAEIGRGQPDLLVLDIIMPDVDGIMVTKLLRSVPETETLPIILITALDTSENRAAGLQVGADDCLGKPFDAAELLARIDLVLRRSRRAGTNPLPRRRQGSDPAALFSGVSLPIVLQMLHLDRKSCQLQVSSDDRVGSLTLDRGELVAATVGEEEGEDAFFLMLGWPEARTEVWDARNESERTIYTPLPHLLVEAVRRQDEATRLRGEPPDFLEPPKLPEPTAASEAAPARSSTRLLTAVREAAPVPPAIFLGNAVVAAEPGHGREAAAGVAVAGEVAPAGKVVDAEPAAATGRFTADVVREARTRARAISGFLGGALVDRDGAAVIDAPAVGITDARLDLAALGRAAARVGEEMMVNAAIEDIVISYSDQLHLIRPVETLPDVQIYLVLDRVRVNLAHARLILGQIERSLRQRDR